MRNIKPLNVSPLIKSARWSFLFLGFFYGVQRKHFLERYEEKEKPKRLRALEEWRLANLAKEREVLERDAKSLCEGFDYKYDFNDWKDL